jgi:hypothetical protein
MPTKPITEVRSATSQRDNRWVSTVFDQHRSSRFPRGRPWWGYLEYPADQKYDPAFVCELLPGDHEDPFNSSWGAPWLPEQVSSHPNGSGRNYFRLDVKKQAITWNYASIIADDQAATLAYYQAAAKIAHEHGWKAPGLNEPVGFQIESILLAPPRSHKIAEAALAGDPWILGHTSQVNEVLADLISGVRVQNDMRTAIVTPQQVLAGGADIEALIAKAVAAALSAERERNKAKMAKARSARGKPKSRVPSAMPDAA